MTGVEATRVAANGSSPIRQISSVQGVPLNSTSLNNINSNLVPLATNSSVTNSATLDNINDPKALTVSVHLAGNSLHPGDKQTITLLVADKESTNAIAGASVSGKITSPSGQLKKLEGATDDNGKASYSWKIPNDYTIGSYKVKIDISAAGYKDYSGSKTFEVTYIHHHHHFHHHHLHFHHHHHHQNNPSFIIRPHSSNIGTDTNTNTNTNTNHHNHDLLCGSKTETTNLNSCSSFRGSSSNSVADNHGSNTGHNGP